MGHFLDSVLINAGGRPLAGTWQPMSAREITNAVYERAGRQATDGLRAVIYWRKAQAAVEYLRPELARARENLGAIEGEIERIKSERADAHSALKPLRDDWHTAERLSRRPDASAALRDIQPLQTAIADLDRRETLLALPLEKAKNRVNCLATAIAELEQVPEPDPEILGGLVDWLKTALGLGDEPAAESEPEPEPRKRRRR
jgi:hypothetical protein